MMSSPCVAVLGSLWGEFYVVTVAMLLWILTLACWAVVVNAHGRMIEPPQRGSLWRHGYNVAKNYDDNALNCGGYQVQWLLNAGRCGHCGDSFRGPREHERGGKYASDVIPRKYISGQVIDVTIDITANHGGYFQFYLCPQSRLSEMCFRQHPMYVVGEGYKHKLRTLRSPIHQKIQIKLPDGLSCDHCVLQWRWNCAQSYGMDWETGRYCKGCGQQEQFWNCADVAIESPLRFRRPSFKKRRKPMFRHVNLMDNPVPGYLHVPSVKMAHFLPSAPPPVFQQPTGECRGSSTYGIALDAWCTQHCPLGFCPPTHCVCT